MSRSLLIDTTRCIGCRSCQVACKHENGLPGERTEFFASPGGYQNPRDLSATTFSLVEFNEVIEDDGELRWVFAKRQCMHCLDPSCASACLVAALTRDEQGAVVYDDSRCIGCRYCMLACPFGVPSLEWERTIPYIRKCTFCMERARTAPPDGVNGTALGDEARSRHAAAQRAPACASSCPTEAIVFGERDELLDEARRRISARPGRYVRHVYGESEAGGTAMLYMAGVPFGQLGFPTHLGTRSFPSYSAAAKEAVPPLILGVGALLGGVYWLSKRREAVAASEPEASGPAGGKAPADRGGVASETAALEDGRPGGEKDESEREEG